MRVWNLLTRGNGAGMGSGIYDIHQHCHACYAHGIAENFPHLFQAACPARFRSPGQGIASFGKEFLSGGFAH
jgi:hypothetical protein